MNPGQWLSFRRKRGQTHWRWIFSISKPASENILRSLPLLQGNTSGNSLIFVPEFCGARFPGNVHELVGSIWVAVNTWISVLVALARAERDKGIQVAKLGFQWVPVMQSPARASRQQQRTRPCEHHRQLPRRHTEESRCRRRRCDRECRVQFSKA